jgi:hypothetical protein
MNITLPNMATYRLGHYVYLGRNMGEARLCRRFRGMHMPGFRNIYYCRKRSRDRSAGEFADTLNFCDIPQDISKEDHNFLDDLFQEQNLDNQRETVQSDSKPVPRAELIVNTSEVKRAQLVVNGRVVERAELVRRRNQ